MFFSDEMEKIKIPKDMDDAKALGTVLSKYKDTYYSQVLVAYFATYVLYPLREHKHIIGKLYLKCASVKNVSIYSGPRGNLGCSDSLLQPWDAALKNTDYCFLLLVLQQASLTKFNLYLM